MSSSASFDPSVSSSRRPTPSEAEIGIVTFDGKRYKAVLVVPKGNLPDWHNDQQVRTQKTFRLNTLLLAYQANVSAKSRALPGRISKLTKEGLIDNNKKVHSNAFNIDQSVIDRAKTIDSLGAKRLRSWKESIPLDPSEVQASDLYQNILTDDEASPLIDEDMPNKKNARKESESQQEQGSSSPLSSESASSSKPQSPPKMEQDQEEEEEGDQDIYAEGSQDNSSSSAANSFSSSSSTSSSASSFFASNSSSNSSFGRSPLKIEEVGDEEPEEPSHSASSSFSSSNTSSTSSSTPFSSMTSSSSFSNSFSTSSSTPSSSAPSSSFSSSSSSSSTPIVNASSSSTVSSVEDDLLPNDLFPSSSSSSSTSLSAPSFSSSLPNSSSSSSSTVIELHQKPSSETPSSSPSFKFTPVNPLDELVACTKKNNVLNEHTDLNEEQIKNLALSPKAEDLLRTEFLPKRPAQGADFLDRGIAYTLASLGRFLGDKIRRKKQEELNAKRNKNNKQISANRRRFNQHRTGNFVRKSNTESLTRQVIDLRESLKEEYGDEAVDAAETEYQRALSNPTGNSIERYKSAVVKAKLSDVSKNDINHEENLQQKKKVVSLSEITINPSRETPQFIVALEEQYGKELVELAIEQMNESGTEPGLNVSHNKQKQWATLLYQGDPELLNNEKCCDSFHTFVKQYAASLTRIPRSKIEPPKKRKRAEQTQPLPVHPIPDKGNEPISDKWVHDGDNTDPLPDGWTRLDDSE